MQVALAELENNEAKHVLLGLVCVLHIPQDVSFFRVFSEILPVAFLLLSLHFQNSVISI